MYKIPDSFYNEHFRIPEMPPEIKHCELCGASLTGLKDNVDYGICADCADHIKKNFKIFVQACMESLNFDDTADFLIDYARDVLMTKSAYSEEEKRN